MRRGLLASALGLVTVIALTPPGLAADVRPYRSSMSLPPYNWSGLYVGGVFGGAWSENLPNIAGTAWDPGTTRFIGGVTAGYNLHVGAFLMGVEGDFAWGTFDRVSTRVPTQFGPVLATASEKWISTLAVRFGLVADRWLVFGKIGGGWANDSATLAFANGTIWDGAHTSRGWMAGGGLEYGFKPNWTVKLEYDFVALGHWTSPTTPAAELAGSVQMIKFGMNYRFQDGGAGALGDANLSSQVRRKPSDEDLQKASQNPVASLVSVPFQNNTNFNNGPFGRTQNVLNIQPVVPMSLNSEWNLISRTIIPVTSQPSPLFDSTTNGIGDVNETLFLSPAHPGPLIWGIGPIVTTPSATDVILGSGKVLAGPSIVLLVTPGHWVIGVLVNNQWSVGGDPARKSVNFFTSQPFINYNMREGWFLTSSPIITADWNAAPGQQWTVPLGGGFGRLFKVGDQPVQALVQGFYNVVHPDNTGTWSMRAQLSLLFPK